MAKLPTFERKLFKGFALVMALWIVILTVVLLIDQHRTGAERERLEQLLVQIVKIEQDHYRLHGRYAASEAGVVRLDPDLLEELDSVDQLEVSVADKALLVWIKDEDQRAGALLEAGRLIRSE